MKRYALVFWGISLMIPFSASGGTCPLEKGVYQDLDGSGFQLEFGPPKVDEVQVLHAATIMHPDRGTVFEFDFANGLGFAHPFLRTRDSGDQGAEHNIHFFDDKLRSTDYEEFAPPYVFIEGLGPADWYGAQAEMARKIPIGTPLWKLVGCNASRGVPESAITKKSKSLETLSSAEWVTGEGRITAAGEIKDVCDKGGQKFLTIDYGEWLSEEECRRRVKAGILDLGEDDCEIDSLRYDNQIPNLKELAVTDDVEIVIAHPSRPAMKMTWDEFVTLQRTRPEDARELWDGLWQIERRDNRIERIEWVYTP